MLTGSTLLTVLGTATAWDGGPTYSSNGGYGNYSKDLFPPSYYGYNLDQSHPGYYGGGNYREYYSIGRGYGLANFPGPLPGPIYQYYVSHSGIKFRGLKSPPPPPPFGPPVAINPMAASLVVHVPADAEIWVDGVKTVQTGATRKFHSPPLAAGRTYNYELKARWVNDGKPVEQVQNLMLRPGEESNVSFPMSPETDLLSVPHAEGPELGK